MENFDKVKDIIVDRLGVDADKVTEDASFKDDLGADSLDIAELVMELEDEFGTEIPDEEAEKINTVGDAVKYINSLLVGSDFFFSFSLFSRKIKLSF